MDNHPIPQDVTHFQFKLIGELTIKQFAYVGAGGILAWICFSIPMNFLLKLLFGLLFGGSGVIFAFIPIEGRPADLMLSYFFKALFKPNQFVFHKESSLTFADTHYTLATAPSSIIQAQPPIAQTIQSLNKAASIQQTPSNTQQPYIPPIIKPIAPITPPPQIHKSEPPAPTPKQVIEPVKQQVEKPLQEVPTVIPSPVAQLTAPQANPVHEQLQSVLAQKEQLEKQLALLQQQLAQKQVSQSDQPQTPPVSTLTSINSVSAQPTITPNVPDVIGAQPASAVQTSAQSQPTPPPPVKTPVTPSPGPKMPMVSDFPNIILGVVRDSRGNVIPNILVEVKDTENNPVRAFKTNALGQFASATPLLNGTYMIVFEDPSKKHKFDTIQITAAGEVMQPIEVISVDDREELRKELFGT